MIRPWYYMYFIGKDKVLRPIYTYGRTMTSLIVIIIIIIIIIIVIFSMKQNFKRCGCDVFNFVFTNTHTM